MKYKLYLYYIKSDPYFTPYNPYKAIYQLVITPTTPPTYPLHLL